MVGIISHSVFIIYYCFTKVIIIITILSRRCPTTTAFAIAAIRHVCGRYVLRLFRCTWLSENTYYVYMYKI